MHQSFLGHVIAGHSEHQYSSKIILALCSKSNTTEAYPDQLIYQNLPREGMC